MAQRWKRFIPSVSTGFSSRVRTLTVVSDFRPFPGVYLHKDATYSKAEYYAWAVQLVPGGHFYSVKWETLVDRNLRVTVPHPRDQWVQEPQGVIITAAHSVD